LSPYVEREGFTEEFDCPNTAEEIKRFKEMTEVQLKENIEFNPEIQNWIYS
jgi:uncharacterized protein with von Willebrand factor type A (vWA) domain